MGMRRAFVLETPSAQPLPNGHSESEWRLLSLHPVPRDAPPRSEESLPLRVVSRGSWGLFEAPPPPPPQPLAVPSAPARRRAGRSISFISDANAAKSSDCGPSDSARSGHG